MIQNILELLKEANGETEESLSSKPENGSYGCGLQDTLRSFF